MDAQHSQANGHELRDPNDFEAELEEHTPLAPSSNASNQAGRSIFHRRSGTGTNLSINSMSTKRTRLGLGRRTLGLCLMLVTISMWTASNFLASSIFADDTYSKPFFVTWLNVGMFSFFLMGPLARRALQGRMNWSPWSRHRAGASIYSPIATSQGRRAKPADGDEDDGDGDDGEVINGISRQSPAESLILDESMVLGSHGFANDTEKLSMYETAKLSLEFCMIWFASNYFVSACLQYTTVASSTVIGSTSSVFTLAFGACLGAERFTYRKLLSVIVCLAGVGLISQVDLSGESDENRGSFPEKSRAEMAIGDVLALAGAAGYGLYTILLKKRVGDENRMDVFVFFGFIGMWDLLLLWPLIFVMHWTGIETFEMPPSGKVWWVIIANGFISLISDVSWTYSMLLTSPLVITVGLSLAIPMSLLGQMVINGQKSSFVYWLGSAIVAISFLIVNQESKREAQQADQEIFSASSAQFVVSPREDGRGDEELEAGDPR